ncbi:type II secretion system protein GspK [Lichenifustis flavocetrariae]|uniref:General secretion pathway protein GspK n=1 Tax=Lichenifustis flavocetrariae TaxID=2949735 RepID=A0AA41YZ64_9HYPH|nr:type II secretion system protein GspK [Lichenifustis flavocetrariae]MCW6509922.1 general secretion pathway protein GspK [Lichenifustis flavocetrariae]
MRSECRDAGDDPDPRTRGSILLPVIVVLLLIASAATAMTMQTKVSLREAGTRRDRLVLGLLADAAARSAALALAQAAATQAAAPFAIDGTPQSCALADGRRLVIEIQDEGGLVDLNKGTPDLLARIFKSAGVSAWDANAMVAAIKARRQPEGGPVEKPGAVTRRAPPVASRQTQGFESADEIDALPGMTAALFDQLHPMFSVANGAAGLDPEVAGRAIRSIIPTKEMTAPDFESLKTPSSHTAFTITATVTSPLGMRFRRREALRLDPSAGPVGRVTAWDEVPALGDLDAGVSGAFCGRVAAALSTPS